MDSERLATIRKRSHITCISVRFRTDRGHLDQSRIHPHCHPHSLAPTPPTGRTNTTGRWSLVMALGGPRIRSPRCLGALQTGLSLGGEEMVVYRLPIRQASEPG